jgi:predicted TIM-barrel fold metal-dependent hydrolase
MLIAAKASLMSSSVPGLTIASIFTIKEHLISFGKPRFCLAHAQSVITPSSIGCLKMTYLIGGNPDPEKYDAEQAYLMDKIVDTCEKYDLTLQTHSSAGGSSDISNYYKFVEKYGKRIRIHIIHMGGGVSGHIKMVPRFINWLQEGYQVFTDGCWAVGFAPRLMVDEIAKAGIGEDNIIWGSDEPWSDLPSEYWKWEGLEISEEFKNKIFWQNAERVYGVKAIKK